MWIRSLERFQVQLTPPMSQYRVLNPLASPAQIERTPSMEDGLPWELEEDLRAYGCKLIQQAGILLNQCVWIALVPLQS